MNGSWTRGRDTDAQLACELRVRTSHQRRHFFMPRLCELHPLGRALERSHDAVDAVARISVDPAHAPFAEALKKKIADCFAHSQQKYARSIPSGSNLVAAFIRCDLVIRGLSVPQEATTRRLRRVAVMRRRHL